MLGKRTWILIVVVIVAVVVIAWRFGAPDIGNWPRYEYFRCLDCAGPASIDPWFPEQWGCTGCGFTTYALPDRFRMAKQSEVPGGEVGWVAAMGAAGIMAPPDSYGQTPIEIYTKAGGHGYRVTPANAYRVPGPD